MGSEENTKLLNGVDTPDVFGFRNASSTSSNVAPLVVNKEANYYKMNHPKRGIATIFNHEKFLLPNLRDRSGTNVDCYNLKKCLENIGFDVKVHNDLETRALMTEVDALSKIDYSSMDCLVICILSHGEEGVIFSKDSAYKHEDIWGKFTADKCKTLAGKPKLFFIQACQGSRLDPGTRLQTEMDAGGNSYRIPIHADFLFAYSTIPGIYFHDTKNIDSNFIKKKFCFNCFTCFQNKTQDQFPECSCFSEDGFYSWRNTSRGSWFIQALVSELSENVFHFDLLTLLTFVNRRVAIDYESNVPDNSFMHAQKQIPCISSMLTRLVQFTPPNKLNLV